MRTSDRPNPTAPIRIGSPTLSGQSESERDIDPRPDQRRIPTPGIHLTRSLLTSLAPSLYTAVRAGRFRYFVIDEAHTVAVGVSSSAQSFKH